MLFPIKYIGPSLLFVAVTWGFTEAACSKDSNSLVPPVIQPVPPMIPVAKPDSSQAYLALGDSYTIGQSVAVADRYPVQAVQMLKMDSQACKDPEIIATTGWTTANLIDALKNKTAPIPYAVVTLLIGVNNQYQGLSQAAYRDQFSSLLQQAIQLAGNNASHVMVLSIPDYSVTPFARDSDTSLIAAQIDSFNRINAAISLNAKVHYLDITGESRKAAYDPSLIAGDGLHFSGKEYAVWASMMEPVMKIILTDK